MSSASLERVGVGQCASLVWTALDLRNGPEVSGGPHVPYVLFDGRVAAAPTGLWAVIGVRCDAITSVAVFTPRHCDVQQRLLYIASWVGAALVRSTYASTCLPLRNHFGKGCSQGGIAKLISSIQSIS